MPDFDFTLALSHLIHLALAYGFAWPIGWEREKNDRTAGLRTFPLVAAAGCGFVLIGQATLGGDPEAMSRVMYGLMTGIGFIGGGAILKKEGGVSGTATAASIWITGAIGAAVAFRRYEIAVVLCVVTFLTFRFVTDVKGKVNGGRRE